MKSDFILVTNVSGSSSLLIRKKAILSVETYNGRTKIILRDDLEYTVEESLDTVTEYLDEF